MNNYPLVSVVVLTYNSEKTVLETLNSITAQNYNNLEVIISDDKSIDSTITLCKQWLDQNGSKFVNATLVQSEVNTGVSVNYKRGIKAASGIWIKGLAGDDTLISDAISQFVEFVANNDCKMCICDLNLFCEDKEVSQVLINSYKGYFAAVKMSYEDKVRSMAKGCLFAGPGYFFQRDLMLQTDSPSKKYPMWEEYSICYNVLMAGYDILPLDKKLVNYRVSGNSLSIGRGKKLMNPQMYKDCKTIFYDLQLPLLKKYNMYHHILGYILNWYNEGIKIRYNGGWRAKMICSVTNLFNPFTYAKSLKH